MIKRIIPVFCALMILFSCVVPVFAAGITEAELLYSGSSNYSTFSVDSDYPITLMFKLLGSDGDLIYSSPPLTIDLGDNIFGNFDDLVVEGFSISYRFLTIDGSNDIQFFIGLCSNDGCLSTLSKLNCSRIDIFRVVEGQSGSTSPVSVLDVFDNVGSLALASFGTMSGIFWTGSDLTFLGILGVVGLAIAVIVLLVFVISKYLRFR